MTASEAGEADLGEGWGRMCLVRQDSTTLLGRLYGALGHIEDSMTDQSMGNTYRPKARKEAEDAPTEPWQLHPSNVAFRDQSVQQLQHAIQVTFDKLSPSERAEFLSHRGGRLARRAPRSRSGACELAYMPARACPFIETARHAPAPAGQRAAHGHWRAEATV